MNWVNTHAVEAATVTSKIVSSSTMMHVCVCVCVSAGVVNPSSSVHILPHLINHGRSSVFLYACLQLDGILCI